MKKFLCIAIITFSLVQNSIAQSVAINASGATANASSILDVQSTTKGMLIPRMTKGQKNAIASPAIGLLIYQVVPDSVGFHYYNGTQWLWLNPMPSGGNDWSITGNAGIDTAVNFIGTTDDMPLAFKVNNEKSGRIESEPLTANTYLGNRSGALNTGTNNTAFGYRSLATGTIGNNNTAIGTRAMENYNPLSGSDNVAVGYLALRNSNGSFNVGVGAQVLSAASGNFNVAVGHWTLRQNTTGSNNTAIGHSALTGNTTGRSNLALGSYALLNNTIGNKNIAFGDSALFTNVSSSKNIAIGDKSLFRNSTGRDLTAIGDSALYNNLSGIKNTALGSKALVDNTTGSQNIAVGGYSLHNNTTGSNNVAIGDSAAYSNTTISKLIAIGSKSLFANTFGTNLTALGDSALYSNTTGYKNIAIGNKSLSDNTTGYQNIAIGHNTLKENLIGFANIAIGDSALPVSTTNWNLAIGRYALLETTTGDKNIAIGEASLRNNITGANNVAIGYASQVSASTNNRNNTSLGFRSAGSMQGYSNTAIGGDAMGKPSTSYTVNNTVAVGDSTLFNIQTGANTNTAIGSKTLFSNTTGRSNTAIGARALYNNTTGTNNVALGDSAAYNSTVSEIVAVGSKALFTNTTGLSNTAVGVYSLYNNVSGDENTAIGKFAMLSGTNPNNNTAVGVSALASNNGDGNVAFGLAALGNNFAGDFNTAIGTSAGQNAIGNGNVFIGYNAGFNETGSNKLYIENSTSVSPLVYGDFATNLLRVNGTLNINNDYSFPNTDGIANQVLRTNGAGNVSWATVNGESTTASNGLTLTGSNVALGGTLLNNTSITHGNFNVQHFLSGTGDFLITTPSINALTVLSTGNTGINTTTPTHRLHLVNDVSGTTNNYANGMFIQNTNATAGQATLAFKNTVLPGNRAWITGMNAFDNYVIAYGDSLTSTDVVLRVDTAGYVGINPTGLPSSRLDVVGSFGTAIRTTTVNTTLDVDDHTIIIGTAAGAITVTLPVASTCDRRVYIIVNRSGSNQTVTSYLDFAGTATTIAANSAITIQSNGTNWFRIQ